MNAPLNDELHRLDPKTLSATEKKALKLAATARLYRVRNGWQGRGVPRVSLATATSLQVKGLVAPTIQGAQLLAVTGAGRTVLAVMDQRAGR